MTGLKVPVWVAAGSASAAFLAKAVLWGKEIANGKSRNPGDGFRETDRERLANVAQTAMRDHTMILNGVTALGVSLNSLQNETKEQTAVLREMRDTLRDVCGVIRTSIPR